MSVLAGQVLGQEGAKTSEEVVTMAMKSYDASECNITLLSLMAQVPCPGIYGNVLNTPGFIFSINTVFVLWAEPSGLASAVSRNLKCKMKLKV